MNRLWVALFLAAALALPLGARAQDIGPSPRQIQGMIASGQENQAVQALQNVLRSHPHSGMAWYLLAEAYDAQNRTGAAAQALNRAERADPGLPFANPQEVAALRAHLTAPRGGQGTGGGHIVLYVIIGGVLLLLALRFLPRRGLVQHPYGYNAPTPPPPGAPYGGYGGGYGGYGGYGPRGGGFGSAILGGLAAGAGFAAGERIIDGMMGGEGGGPVIDQGGFDQGGFGQGGMDQGPDLSRDDGLLGNPGWDNSGGGDFDNSGWS